MSLKNNKSCVNYRKNKRGQQKKEFLSCKQSGMEEYFRKLKSNSPYLSIIYFQGRYFFFVTNGKRNIKEKRIFMIKEYGFIRF